MTWRVEQGDCLERLKELDADSLDCCICDPPYGLSKEPDIAEVVSHWVAGDKYEHKSSGFMSKSWDSFVPGPEYWREVYRVLKPGAHLLCFAGTRTWDLMSIAIRFAGFENRDTIGHQFCLQWVYGSGFPKSLDVSKAIDKAAGATRVVVGTKRHARDGDVSKQNWTRNNTHVGSDWDMGSNEKHMMITAPATDAARQWDGWGTALKPSWEPILVFRKPLSESTVAKNVLRWNTGGLNIDATRVAYQGDADKASATPQGRCTSGAIAEPDAGRDLERVEFERPELKGRWPSNTVFSHVPPDENGEGGCHKIGVKKVKGQNGGNSNAGSGIFTFGQDDERIGKSCGYADPDGLETVEEYDCVEGCPVAELDRQSGISRSGDYRPDRGKGGIWSPSTGIPAGPQYGDTGGASRFFSNFSWEEGEIVPFLYQSKASRGERNAGCDALPERTTANLTGRQENSVGLVGNPENRGQTGSPYAGTTGHSRTNGHPTIKPIALMRWLVNLVTPVDGTILDPFCGSGTTGCAAVLEGFNFIGIERDTTEGYVEIAKARIAYWENHTLDAKVSPKSDAKAPPKPELQASLFDIDRAECA